ncbi:MAG TPA: cupin domain-containing protein [Actinopolymorphaceae bacterium]|nr:cupin domain-containing protein [Actinopolymorphaceae bacterium]
MSYPPPRYTGDSGEISGVYRPGSSEPQLGNPAGTTVDYLATGESTGGDFGLYRWNFGATPSGPDAHFHKTISESFFILSGTVRLYDGKEWKDTAPGDFLYVPPGGIHAFKNESGEKASMLLLFAPGAPREEYFETLFEVAAGRVLTAEERADLYLRHDNHWL